MDCVEAEGESASAAIGPEIAVSVAYSPQPRVVERVALRLPAGATVADALRASGLAERHGWTLDEHLAVAVWSKPGTLRSALRDADRVEVTRGLRVDPKEARRQRYQQQPAAGGRRRASDKA